MPGSRSGMNWTNRTCKARAAVLRAIEEGNNETAAVADLISNAVLKRHLETMDRLDIEYDFLPRESEILHLHFWDAAFTKLKEAGVLTYESEGKNKGCWVMRRAGTARKLQPRGERGRRRKSPRTTRKSSSAPTARLATSAKISLITCGSSACWAAILDTGNSTGTQIRTTAGSQPRTAKKIIPTSAMWRRFTTLSMRASPRRRIQSIEALRGLGHDEAADRYTHFSYEMVALTPRCAAELGYTLSEEDQGRPWIEVSGRKGFGVKADDLLDALIASARKEVDTRHPELR